MHQKLASYGTVFLVVLISSQPFFSLPIAQAQVIVDPAEPPVSGSGGFTGGKTNITCFASSSNELTSVNEDDVNADIQSDVQQNSNSEDDNSDDQFLSASTDPTDDSFDIPNDEASSTDTTTFTDRITNFIANTFHIGHATAADGDQTGTLITGIQINDLNRNNTPRTNLGLVRPPFNKQAYLLIKGPFNYLPQSRFYGTPIPNVPVRTRKIYISTNGLAQVDLPYGRWKFYASHYNGIDNGHNYLQQERRRIHVIPQVDVPPHDEVNFPLVGLHGAITNPIRGHLKIRAFVTPPKQSARLGGQGIAVTIKGQSTLRGQISDIYKLAYTGPDGIARFFNLDPSRIWFVTKVDYHGYAFKTDADPLHIISGTVVSNRVDLTPPLARPGPPPVFSKSSYNYILEDQKRVVDALNKSDLDCQTKAKTLRALEKINWFSEYDFLQKRRNLLKVVKDDHILSIIVKAEVTAGDFDFYVNEEAPFLGNAEGPQIASVRKDHIPPTSTNDFKNYKVDLAYFKTSNPFTPNRFVPTSTDTVDDIRDWPVWISVTRRVSVDLVNTLLWHRTPSKNEAAFAPYVQELARAQKIAWLFGEDLRRFNAQTKQPTAKQLGIKVSPYQARYAGKWRNKQWMKQHFPQYVDWFYTYWFYYEAKGVTPTTYNDRQWTSDEMRDLTQFFQMYKIDSQPLIQVDDPVSMVVTAVATGGLASNPIEAGILSVVNVLGKFVGRRALQLIAKGSSVALSDIAAAWLSSIEKAEVRKLVGAYARQGIRGLPASIRTAIRSAGSADGRNLVYKKYADAMVAQWQNESADQIRAELVSEFGQNQAQQILNDIQGRLETAAFQSAKKYGERPTVGKLKDTAVQAAKVMVRRREEPVEEPPLETPDQLTTDVTEASATIATQEARLKQQEATLQSINQQLKKLPTTAKHQFALLKGAQTRTTASITQTKNIIQTVKARLSDLLDPFAEETPVDRLQAWFTDVTDRFRPLLPAERVAKTMKTTVPHLDEMFSNFKVWLTQKHAQDYMIALSKKGSRLANTEMWHLYVNETYSETLLQQNSALIYERAMMLEHSFEFIGAMGGDFRKDYFGFADLKPGTIESVSIIQPNTGFNPPHQILPADDLAALERLGRNSDPVVNPTLIQKPAGRLLPDPTNVIPLDWSRGFMAYTGNEIQDYAANNAITVNDENAVMDFFYKMADDLFNPSSQAIERRYADAAKWDELVAAVRQKYNTDVRNYPFVFAIGNDNRLYLYWNDTFNEQKYYIYFMSSLGERTTEKIALSLDTDLNKAAERVIKDSGDTITAADPFANLPGLASGVDTSIYLKNPQTIGQFLTSLKNRPSVEYIPLLNDFYHITDETSIASQGDLIAIRQGNGYFLLEYYPEDQTFRAIWDKTKFQHRLEDFPINDPQKLADIYNQAIKAARVIKSH